MDVIECETFYSSLTLNSVSSNRKKKQNLATTNHKGLEVIKVMKGGRSTYASHKREVN